MSASSTAVTGITADSHLHLLDLPQELQDSIFEFAYQRAPGEQIMDREGWKSKLSRKLPPLEGIEEVRASYPGDEASDFMVSKQYFLLAAKAWVISQPLHLEAEAPDTLEAPFWTEGILAAFAQDIVGDLYMLFYACRATSLKTLKLEIKTGSIIIQQKTVSLTERLLTVEELETSSFSSLKYLSGLASFSAVASNDWLLSRLGAKEKATLEANAELIETTYTPFITAGKVDVAPESEDFMPLYTGYRVNLLSPNVQDIAGRRDLVSGLKNVAVFFMCVDRLPPLIESTVAELLDIVEGSGAKCGVDLARGNAFLMRTSLRAQAEERRNRAEARMRILEDWIRQMQALVAGLGTACLILVVGMVWKAWRRPPE